MSHTLEHLYFSEEVFSYLSTETQAAAEVPNVVGEVFGATAPEISAGDLESLFLYTIPEDVGDDACTKVEAKEPFDLGSELFQTSEWRKEALVHPTTVAIARLKNVVDRIAAETTVNWIGIYRLVEPKEGAPYLVKLAYAGNFSRAKFPLTESFKKTSNNSWVAMEGKSKLIQDLEAYSGPYYICDGLVNSEMCVPIFDENRKVIGIIDAESYVKNFFAPKAALYILKACVELGKIHFGF